MRLPRYKRGLAQELERKLKILKDVKLGMGWPHLWRLCSKWIRAKLQEEQLEMKRLGPEYGESEEILKKQNWQDLVTNW